jgi:glycosyltransferase involved in cell wall biosynthesis
VSSGVFAGSTVVLIPALNEASTIAEVVKNVAPYGMPLVVSDGSTDDTPLLAREAGAEVVELRENRGYEGALDTGFAFASEQGATFVITFDADGQFDAALLGEVNEALTQAGVELVIGIRPEFARFGERLFGMYTRIRFGVADILCGVKGYSVSLHKAHGCFDRGHSVGTELALYGLRQRVSVRTVLAPVRPRLDEVSRFGSGWRANMRILNALRLAIFQDITSTVGREKTEACVPSQ